MCTLRRMDMISTLAMASGMAWSSGLRLYMLVFMAGMFQRFHVMDLPVGLAVLSHTWVLGTAGTLMVVEFVADKIPAVDSVWDAVHTFIRIPAGAALAAAALGTFHEPAFTVVAALLGGTLAATSHFTKATSRAVINTSPEPVSNIAASIAEETVVGGATLLMHAHPLIFLCALGAVVVSSLCVLYVMVRYLRRVIQAIVNQCTTAIST